MRRVLAVAIALGARAAMAHVAPSIDDNNRYLKLTPQADRVRLVYTIFFGEVPGAQTRPAIDADRDGTISEREAREFGSKLASEVAAMLEVTVDRVPTALAWEDIAVGMASPSTKAGSFSVDMIASFCLSPAGGHHALQLRDRFRLPRPGETEVRVEDSPGVRLQIARVGPADDPSHDYGFVGAGGPLSDDGVELVFEATDQAPTTGSACGATPAVPNRRLSTGLVVGAAAVLGFVLAAIVALVRRRRIAT